MVGRSLAFRAIAAASIVVACTDLSGLQSDGTTDAGVTADASSDATTGVPEGGTLPPPPGGPLDCADAGAKVLYCATFDPGVPLTTWGAVDTTTGGAVAIATDAGASAPGALHASVAAHALAGGYVRARMTKTLATSTRLHITFAVQPSKLTSDENVVLFDFGAWEIAFKLDPGATAAKPMLRMGEPGDGSTAYTYFSLPAVHDYGVWHTYDMDLVLSETLAGGSVASHVDVRSQGQTSTFQLTAHLYTPTKTDLEYGVIASDEATATHELLFDDFLVEAR